MKIAHRINNIRDLIIASQRGFQGVECDLRMYGGKFVLSHDEVTNCACGMTTLDNFLNTARYYGILVIIELKENVGKFLRSHKSITAVISFNEKYLENVKINVTKLLLTESIPQKIRFDGILLYPDYIVITKNNERYQLKVEDI